MKGKWKENERKWKEMKGKWKDNERKMKGKWKEMKGKWKENERKWKEMKGKWKENERKMKGKWKEKMEGNERKWKQKQRKAKKSKENQGILNLKWIRLQCFGGISVQGVLSLSTGKCKFLDRMATYIKAPSYHLLTLAHMQLVGLYPGKTWKNPIAQAFGSCGRK